MVQRMGWVLAGRGYRHQKWVTIGLGCQQAGIESIPRGCPSLSDVSQEGQCAQGPGSSLAVLRALLLVG